MGPATPSKAVLIAFFQARPDRGLPPKSGSTAPGAVDPDKA
jgi:hypothetical protein